MKSSKKKTTKKSSSAKPAAVKAIRKTCDVEGSGLSHYVLMDKKGR